MLTRMHVIQAGQVEKQAVSQNENSGVMARIVKRPGRRLKKKLHLQNRWCLCPQCVTTGAQGLFLAPFHLQSRSWGDANVWLQTAGPVQSVGLNTYLLSAIAA